MGRLRPSTFVDVDGREYIDCLGGFGISTSATATRGSSQRCAAQLDRMALHSQDLLDPLRAMLAKTLALVTPGDLKYSFFCNSGTEAVEARSSSPRAYDPPRQTIVGATKGFTVSRSGRCRSAPRPRFARRSVRCSRDFEHVPFNDLRVAARCRRWRPAAKTCGGDPRADPGRGRA